MRFRSSLALLLFSLLFSILLHELVMELDRRDQDELDARSWVALAVFFVVIVFVIRPVRFKVFRIPVSLDLATVPLLGVIILLASQTMTGTTLRDGFLGSNLGVQPYAIMLLFYSLVCVRLQVFFDPLNLLEKFMMIFDFFPLGLHLYIIRHDWIVSILCILGFSTCWQPWNLGIHPVFYINKSHQRSG